MARASWIVLVWLAVLSGLGISAAFLACFLVLQLWSTRDLSYEYLAIFIAAAVAARGVWYSRSWLAGRVFAWTGLSEMRLKELPAYQARSIFCATDMQTGRHVYFSRDFITTYGSSIQTPGDSLRLADVVQASAAYPVGFPPRRLGDRWLTDGGIYDNMGDQWAVGFERRRREGRLPNVVVDDVPDVLVVVNASAISNSRTWSFFRNVVPGQVLYRITDIMHQNTTAFRRSTLVSEFDRSFSSGDGLRGFLVHISTSPLKLLDQLSSSTDPGRAARASALRGSNQAWLQEDWPGIVQRNCQVRTTLSPLDATTTAELLYHAYTLAWVSAHVFLGSPRLASPLSLSEFHRGLEGN